MKNMARKNEGLSALNALLAIETYMTEKGHFKCVGHTIVITGIQRRDYLSKYLFEVNWKSTDPANIRTNSATVHFIPDGTIETFETRIG